jgi:hypothetical protein
MIQFPQTERLPSPVADVWEDGAAGDILRGEVFASAAAAIVGVVALFCGYFENAPEETPDSFYSQIIESPVTVGELTGRAIGYSFAAANGQSVSADGSVSLLVGYLDENPAEPVEVYGSFLALASDAPAGLISGFAWGQSLAIANATFTIDVPAVLTVEFADDPEGVEPIEVYGSFLTLTGEPPAGLISGYAWGKSLAIANATFTLDIPAVLTVEFADDPEGDAPLEVYSSFLTYADLPQGEAISGLAFGSGLAQGNLSGVLSVSARAAGFSVAAANASGIASISGASFAQGFAQGNLTATAAASGAAWGKSLAVASLSATAQVSGRAAGFSSAAANAGSAIGISGTAAGFSYAVGNLSATASLTAQAAGQGVAAGNLTGIASISGQAAGQGVAVASVLGVSPALISGRTFSHSVAIARGTTIPAGTRINIYSDDLGRKVKVGPSTRHI